MFKNAPIVFKIIFPVLFFALSPVFSQSDSLQTYVKRDTIRVNLLNKAAEKIFSAEPDRATQLLRESEALSDALHYKKGKAFSLLHTGHIFTNKGNYTTAMGYYQDAMAIYQGLKDKKGIANCIYNVGRVTFYLGNYDKALDYYKEALSLAEETGDQRRLTTSLVAIGQTYLKRSNLDKALEYFRKALAIDEKNGNKRGISNDMNSLASVYKLKLDYSQSLEYYNKALILREQLGDQLGIATNLDNIGSLYDALGNDQEAYSYFIRALDIYEKIKYKKGIANTLVNAGIILMSRNARPQAMNLFTRALAIAEEMNDPYGIGVVYFNMGSSKLFDKDYDAALPYFEKSLKIHKQLNTKKEISYNYLKMGKLYLAKKDYDKAMQYATLSSALAEALNLIEVKRDLLLLRSDIYYGTKQYKLAFENRDMHKKLNDSIIDQKNSAKVAQLYKYQFKDKLSSAEKTQNSLKKTVKNRNSELASSQKQKLWWIIGSGLVLLLLILGGSLFYRKTKQKQVVHALEKNQIKQKLLVTQMNPHFIFNSIENIQGLIYDNKKEDAADYLTKFSILTRQILENSNENYISLTEEVNMIRNYMSIQQLLYDNKFDFTLTVEETIDSETIFLPPMLTQPFIENAIKHGLSNTEKNGMIAINFYLTEGKLFFEVTDNGKGFDAVKKSSKHKSLAMTITKERLINYTKNQDFVVQADNIKDKNEKVVGAKVVFEIPYIYEN
jgi:tetratricopeptide (TPR) repeat protein